jgi:hypothetical protein
MHPGILAVGKLTGIDRTPPFFFLEELHTPRATSPAWRIEVGQDATPAAVDLAATRPAVESCSGWLAVRRAQKVAVLDGTTGTTLYGGDMANNEQVLLDQVLKDRQAERSTPIADEKAFELFACEQALRSHELSPDEIAEGVVGGSNDGGLDGVYVFLNGALLNEDSEVFDEVFLASKIPTGSLLEVWLVQAKRESSFSETTIEKVADSTRRLLRLAEDDADLAQLYGPPVVTRTGFFRAALQKLAARHPKVAIHFVYASKGDTREVNTKVLVKANDLKKQFEKEVMPGAAGRTELMGAAELWKLSNAHPSYTMQLTYQENATSGTSGTSHVALVTLRDYLKFLTGEDGDLRRHIFDWNVRDFQGNVEVNTEIEASLRDPAGPEFWWLNNGVTVVCSKASVIGKTFSLDDVQVVNGLQTSHTIFNVLRSAPDDHPALNRAVLVRILVTGDNSSTRDQVIRATNRQTSVGVASLRATDDIQRNIEAYFLAHGWYYDRRKNYYRNIGKSPERIVSIPLLAQAVMAMGLSRPDDSRARPSSLLKRDDDYKKIFSTDIPVQDYLWLAQAQRAVDAFLLSEEANATPQERTNLRFHLAMVAAARLVGSRVYAPGQLREVVAEGTSVTAAHLTDCLTVVRDSFTVRVADSKDAPDKVAKGSEFVEFLLDRALPPEDA